MFSFLFCIFPFNTHWLILFGKCTITCRANEAHWNIQREEREEGTAEVQRETQASGERHIFGSVRQFQKNNVVHTHRLQC